MTPSDRAVSPPHTPPADGETQLVGGPFGGFNVPKPKDRWGRVQVEDTDDHDVLHVYRPKRDGTWVYDGPTKVLFRIPTGDRA